MEFMHFPDIEGFHNVVKFVKANPEFISGSVKYRCKVKLHGTNAAIRICNGEIGYQSRSRLISVKDDNVNFAKWGESNIDYWKSIDLRDAAIYGEWCGSGIMKGTSINKINKKIFVVFAIDDTENFITDPEIIKSILKDPPEDVYILPWHGDPLIIDFHNIGKLRVVLDKINDEVQNMEQCDPWVKQTFNIEGGGEGFVYYPDSTERQFIRSMIFKAKGKNHRVVHTKESVQIDPEMAQSIGEFVDLFVTEPRLEQGIAAIGGSFEMKNIGNFIKWMNLDIIKESAAELEASGLTWEQVQKDVTNAVKVWFINKNKEI